MEAVDSEKRYFQCPFCTACQDCAEFQKLAELKESGLMLYRHKPSLEYKIDSSAQEAGVTESIGQGTTFEDITRMNDKNSKDVFILQNIKDIEITSADILPEFERKRVKCPRCQHIMARVHILLETVPALNRKDIRVVCDFCQSKQSYGVCYICDNVAKKFAARRGIGDERSKIMKKSYQMHLDKIQDILAPDEHKKTQEEYKKRTCSDVDFNRFIQRLPPESVQHMSDVDQFLFQPKRPKTVPVTNTFYIADEDDTISVKSGKIMNVEKVKIRNAHEVLEKMPSDLKSFSLDNIHEIRARTTLMNSGESIPVLKQKIRSALKMSRDVKPKDRENKFLKRKFKSSLMKLQQNDIKEEGYYQSLRKYHSEESLITSFSGITEEILKKHLKYFFPQTNKKKQEKVKSSIELIKETRDRLVAETEEKKKNEEIRLKKTEEEQNKIQARLEQKKVGREAKKKKDKRELTRDTKESSDESFYNEKTEKKIKKQKRLRDLSAASDEQRRRKLKEIMSSKSREDFDDESKYVKSRKDRRKEDDKEKESKSEMLRREKKSKTGKDKEVYEKEISRDKMRTIGGMDKEKGDKKSHKEKLKKSEVSETKMGKELASMTETTKTKDAKQVREVLEKSKDKENKQEKEGEAKEKDEKQTKNVKQEQADKVKVVTTREQVERPVATSKDKKITTEKADKTRDEKAIVEKLTKDDNLTQDSQVSAQKREKSKTDKQKNKAVQSHHEKEIKLQGVRKKEVDLLNKVLANQEKEKIGELKIRQAEDEKLRKAQEAADKVTTMVSGQPFKEAVASIKVPPIQTDIKENVGTSKKATDEIDVKSIRPLKTSQDDLILKLVKVRERKPEKSPEIKKLPSIPIRQKVRKKKSVSDVGATSEQDLDLESLLRKKIKPYDEDVDEIIIGTEICEKKAVPVKPPPDIMPALFKSVFTQESGLPGVALQPRADAKEEDMGTKKSEDVPKGIVKYALSDRTFIEKGWTMLPTEKVVRKMNVYRMHPSHPEFDWFEHHKSKGIMKYDTGEKLAEFDNDGRGRWFYKNGKIALNYYDCEEINAQQRVIVYSSGEPDDRGRSRPVTVLAMFDYIGNGVVFNQNGKIRLKYNQTEGVLLDRDIGPVSHWKWHSLNDPPVLQQVMIDTHVAYKDPEIMTLGGPEDNKTRPDNEEMLAIEFDNFIKEKSKKSSQKFKPFQVKMKALKINEQFSLRVLDQSSIYLLYRDGSTNLKLNLGMVLDHQEIVDTDTAELGEVSNNIERLPGKTDSLRELQNFVANAKRCDRVRTEHNKRFYPSMPVASVDQLTAPITRGLQPQLRTIPSSTTNECLYKHRKAPGYVL